MISAANSTPATSQLVRGHTLRSEGGVYDAHGNEQHGSHGAGRGKCSCGVLSGLLPSRGARKRWHRQHKAEILALRGLS